MAGTVTVDKTGTSTYKMTIGVDTKIFSAVNPDIATNLGSIASQLTAIGVTLNDMSDELANTDDFTVKFNLT